MPECCNMGISVKYYQYSANAAARRRFWFSGEPVACILYKFGLRSTPAENESAMRSAFGGMWLDKGSFGGGRSLIARAAWVDRYFWLVSIDDLGVAVAFLAHDAARLITGETHYIDGGYHIVD
jgi:hypothetical protein